MKYYSTNKSAPEVSLSQAVIKGLAPDNGLYMPEKIERMPAEFFARLKDMTFSEISFEVAKRFFGEDIPHDKLREIVEDAFNFETPLVKVKENVYSLELFHGPTLAFKDVGARFMARMLNYFISEGGRKEHVTVLVATSGDTGSAVANGFLGIEGIDVVVLYPKGKVTEIQEKQFTTLGQNITALEVDGTFDDCQRLVKNAFTDAELNSRLNLSSANSINVARFLPQAFYYFNAFAQLARQGITRDIVVCVPSGNFGNITAGLFAKRMGLPVKRFIAANNSNDIFLQYLETGIYAPRASVATLANAMDVGDPSNFARIMDLYGRSHEAVTAEISGYRCNDQCIRAVMKDTYLKTGYTLDPHGACAYAALGDGLQPGETGVFLETAHPAKFLETVESVLEKKIAIPAKLEAFMKGTKKSIEIGTNFEELKAFLLNR